MRSNVNPVGRSVQLIGRAAILKAFEMRKVVAWAIFQGKQFLVKYDGDDEQESLQLLNDWLDLISNSVSTYTLAVYDKVPTGGINSQTPNDGSMNFTLSDDRNVFVPGVPGGGYAIMQENAKLRDELSDIKVVLQSMQDRMSEEDEEEEDKQPASIGGVISGSLMAMFNNPAIQDAIAGKLASWLGATPALPPVTRLGSIPGGWQASLGPHGVAVVSDALDVLVVNTPDLPGLLHKLANMSVDKPAVFGQYVTLFQSL